MCAPSGAQHSTAADAPAGSELCYQTVDRLAADTACPCTLAAPYPPGLLELLGLLGTDTQGTTRRSDSCVKN